MSIAKSHAKNYTQRQSASKGRFCLGQMSIKRQKTQRDGLRELHKPSVLNIAIETEGTVQNSC